MILIELCQEVELFEVNTGVFVEGSVSWEYEQVRYHFTLTHPHCLGSCITTPPPTVVTHGAECEWSPSRMYPCMEYGWDSGPSSLPVLGKKNSLSLKYSIEGRDTGWDKRTQARGREWTSEKLSKGCLGFVNRHLSILVTDAYKSPVSDQVLKRKDNYSGAFVTVSHKQAWTQMQCIILWESHSRTDRMGWWFHAQFVSHSS